MYIYLQTYPCLPDRTNGRSPVREKYTHTYPCLPDRTNGRSPVREKYDTPIPAYRTAQMADRRSGKNTTHTYPCLQDRTNGRSPVREKYTHTYPCLQDRTNGRSPVREKYTHTHTHTYPCLPDRTNGRSPVRKKYDTHLSLPTGHRTNGRSPVREKHKLLQACIVYTYMSCTLRLHVLLKSISHFAEAVAVAGLITPSLQHTPLIYADCVQPLQVYKAHPKWYAKGRCA